VTLEFTSDVLIVGAGPAGSTAAALIARGGHSVTVLEKSDFPRFQIGESLLPSCLPILERLGIEPKTDSHLFKRGAQFLCERTGRSQIFDFGEGLDGCPSHAWQVDRTEFDQRLVAQAKSDGARVEFGCKVTSAELTDDSVVVSTKTGTFSGRYLVDATGQDRLLARHFGTAVPTQYGGSAAAYTHYTDLGDAAWAELEPEFDVRILIVDGGWAWVIPLPGRRMSVGIVTRERGADRARIDAYVADSPLVRRLASGATRGESAVVRNFGFKNERPHGARFGCIGDAAGFIDPVFSSGVTLAMNGAAALADRLNVALESGTEADPNLMAKPSAHVGRGLDTFRAVVHRFYRTRFVDHFIFMAPQSGDMRRGVVSVLAGDVWRDDNIFQRMLLTSRTIRGGA
jgi:flavin-dependent dehydrogenase